MAHGGRARGEIGWGHERAVWEQQKCRFTVRLPSKPNNWSDLAGDEGGGDGGRARGEMRGAPKSSVGATKVHCFPFGDEGGGMGGGVGRPMEGGQGGRWGGGPESSVGAIKGALVPPLTLPENWSDLAGDEGGGIGGGVGRWPMAGGKGGDGAGGTREQCGSNKSALAPCCGLP